MWINCGSSLGDTIFWYFANGLNAELIYAYEAEESTYSLLCKNLKYLPEQYRKKVTPINAFIDENTDFRKLLSGRKVSLINADIEGNELELLKSMSAIIKNDRPVIAICAYHKASDLTELFQYIREIVDDYLFMLRKYPSGIGCPNNYGELVLYAIPKERTGKFTNNSIL